LSLLGDQIKEKKIGEACETHGQEDRISIGKPQRKRPPARLSRRWMGDISTELKEIGKGTETGRICLRIGTSGGLL
jgi:hypothetical protein